MVLVTSTNSLYDPPAMLLILKSCFIAVDMTSAKQCKSSLMYSLKFPPLHLPIFCIFLFLYPAKRQCIRSSKDQWMSVHFVYCNPFQIRIIGWKFKRCAHVLSTDTFFASIPIRWEVCIFIPHFFWIDMHRLPNALTGMNFWSSLCSW